MCAKTLEDMSKSDCEHNKKKIVKCVRDSRRTFSNWEQNVLVTKSKDEEFQAHISKVSIEIDGLPREICHYMVKDNFNSRKGTGKV